LALELPHRQSLRYGENPHQQASWYGSAANGWGAAQQLQGKELSYNNLIDLDAALATVLEFGYGAAAQHAAAVVIKHTNPCGVASDSSIAAAVRRALDADRVSAFGGIVALNRELDDGAAEALTGLFLECVVAPAVRPEARQRLASKTNLRVLELPEQALAAIDRRQLRSLLGGVLVQERDDQLSEPSSWQVATRRAPSAAEHENLAFAWRVVRHVRSNAIVVATDGQTLGIGAGQRWLLPLRRHGAAGGQPGHYRRDPPGREPARPGFDRRLRRPGPGDADHGPAPLPALTGGGVRL
jgi:phosphoribosylaminoimidazolecarboxamide formyltransferase/IMP cyclohydrolase